MRLLFSRDVRFCETHFPFNSAPSSSSTPTSVRFLDTLGPGFQGEAFSPHTSPNPPSPPYPSNLAESSSTGPLSAQPSLDESISADSSSTFGLVSAQTLSAALGPLNPSDLPIAPPTSAETRLSPDPILPPAFTDPTIVPNSIAQSKAPRNIRPPTSLIDFVSHTARCLDSPPSPPIISPTPSHSLVTLSRQETYRVQMGVKVYRLQKSLYGLCQASRNWYSKFAASLIQYGFQQFETDHSLFTFSYGDIVHAILIYVDDMILVTNYSTSCAKFKDYLQQRFRIKDLSPLSYFLGIEIIRNSSGLFLNQWKYTLDILTKANTLGSRPAYFPIEQQHQLSQDSGAPISDPGQYHRLVGRLLYLTITRLELSYPIHILSQFLQDPRQGH
ncbi:hypothetical protein CRG98_043243 [Punica granatum]|uniref:Reverse transcriptase Ty1/copia-type domain-containing protein n=1 Tax=Punica granatum TaxID=22663 RepID=A0A2I0HXC0_PUNGR|nr:hypothetical protein CRG98_043243 [Punica granatum]